MKPQVMLLLGVLAYALFSSNASGGFSATPAKKKGAKKGAGTTNVTNIATAKKKKPVTAAQAKAIKEKRRAM